MKFSPILLAAFSLVYGATDANLSGADGSMTNYKQVQDTLNRQLHQNSAHSDQAVLNAYITGADSQIDNAIATVSDALAPYTLGISKAIGNALLGPFVQSVTNGAEVVVANLIGGGEDLVDMGMASALTKSYSKLAAFASKSKVDTSRLQELSDQITKSVVNKSKRAESAEDFIPGLHGAITVFKQTVDTLKEQLDTHDGHASKDVVNAVITGLDSQIDNLASTITTGLNGVTLGISGQVGDFLLGPFFQSVTNGAEVIISNVIGGSVDIVSDGTSKLFSKSLSQLHELGAKLGVKSETLEALEKTRKQVAHLKKDGKEGKPDDKAKRASDADMSGVHGSMTNHKQVQDTLNHQLQSHNGHAAQAVINAYITGADSQIDNSIATLSDALAPYTLGVSKAIGNVLLGPFVQSVTNGAEVLISNVIGGGIDTVSDSSIELYSQALKTLSQASEKFGVNDEIKNNLSQVQQRIATLNNAVKVHSTNKKE